MIPSSFQEYKLDKIDAYVHNLADFHRCAEFQGRGTPDLDIVPWVLYLNAIPEVVTLQSCSGHFKQEFKGDNAPSRFRASRGDTYGHLWLQFEKDFWIGHVSPRLNNFLREHDGFISAEVRYGRVQIEGVLELVFRGKAHKELEENCGHLVRWLRDESQAYNCEFTE